MNDTMKCWKFCGENRSPVARDSTWVLNIFMTSFLRFLSVTVEKCGRFVQLNMELFYWTREGRREISGSSRYNFIFLLQDSSVSSWDQALFSFRVLNKKKHVRENVWKLLKLGLISGFMILWYKNSRFVVVCFRLIENVAGWGEKVGKN